MKIEDSNKLYEKIIEDGSFYHALNNANDILEVVSDPAIANPLAAQQVNQLDELQKMLKQEHKERIDSEKRQTRENRIWQGIIVLISLLTLIATCVK